MTLIELSDKAVDAIRGRAQWIVDSAGFFGDDHDDAAKNVLAALDERTDNGSVDFDDATLAWLNEDGKEMRQVVEENTRLIDGVAIDWEGSTGDAHYVWALGDMAARLAQAADPTLGTAPSLEPEPVDGWRGVGDVPGIFAELRRLGAWWDAIEEPPVGHPHWALSDEVDSQVDGRLALYRKVLELIAEGKIDSTDGAKAALADPRKAVA